MLHLFQQLPIIDANKKHKYIHIGCDLVSVDQKVMGSIPEPLYIHTSIESKPQLKYYFKNTAISKRKNKICSAFVLFPPDI